MTATVDHTPAGHPYETSIGFSNVLRSEWTKLRTVRSSIWTMIAAIASTVILSALTCWRYAYLLHHGQDGGGFDPTALSLNGIYLAQLAAGTLGVLTITSEYTTGMIRATLGAVPQRRALLAAKAIVFATATLITGVILSFAAFEIGQAILTSAHAGTSLRDPGELRACFGAGLYLTAASLLGFGLGALIRHTSGALVGFFALLFAPSAIVDILPASWHDTIQRLMPANAGSQIFIVHNSPRALGPWAGLAVFSLYAAIAIAAAQIAVVRRDA